MNTIIPKPQITNDEVTQQLLRQIPPYTCPRCGSLDVVVVWDNGKPKLKAHIVYRGMGRCKENQ